MNTLAPPLRVAIVDDEPLARMRLARLLSAQNDVQLVGEFGEAAAASEVLPALRCDAIFLDIQMPEMDGFALLETMPVWRRPAIVFVTAHSRHALRAFDARALDYLLKPVDGQRLHESLKRIRERTHLPTHPNQHAEPN